MPNLSRKAGLGRTLNRAIKVAHPRLKKSAKHVVDDNPGQDNARLDLRSVTAQTNLDQFLEEAELAGKQFVTERRNVTIIGDDNKTQTSLYSQNEKLPQISKIRLDVTDYEELGISVPRRPKWDLETTPEQLDELERRSFLEWRKKLARLEENEDVTLTPFEKNIEVWRQLWRVIERSDIVVQILDCRNPMLYLCEDLLKYVEEFYDKMNFILLNKADFLTAEQRRHWHSYFRERNIEAVFFSALIEKKKQEGNHQDASETSDTSEGSNQPENEQIKIHNKFELIDIWRKLLPQVELNRHAEVMSKNMDDVSDDRPLAVGLVGYPNVGKSSCINALLSTKRVAVSATPGKTKHFQTFLIDDMMLCDCPGLVYPNFVGKKSEMVINGILPIDQMKDYVGPVRHIVEKFPRIYFEEIYGLAFETFAKQNISAEDLLNSFGFMRGYMTARGLPDVSRAARVICKDYINGKLLYCEPPPDVSNKLYQSQSKLASVMSHLEEMRKDPKHSLQITARQVRLMAQAKDTHVSSDDFDSHYFQVKSNGFYVKSLPGIGNMTQPVGKSVDLSMHKRPKKEKLRRVYRHLDE